MVLTRRDDGIIVSRERNFHLPRNVEHVSAAVAATAELAGREPCAALWDTRGFPRPEPQSWRFFIDRSFELFKALAIVTDPESIALLGAFPMAMDALLVPVRVFTDEAEALDWIGTFAGGS